MASRHSMSRRVSVSRPPPPVDPETSDTPGCSTSAGGGLGEWKAALARVFFGLRSLGREKPPERPPDKVLIVHGRNEAAKEGIARFLTKLGLEVVLMDEQAARGRTLIEKLEACSSAAFAVVLMTRDDIGALASEPQDSRLRARQNVIFELGFSIAKLTRQRVCVLYEKGVELPSDLGGVEYKLLDAAGAWKFKLAKELYEAGLRFDIAKAL